MRKFIKKHHPRYHNGSKSRNSVPLRNGIFPGTPATALLSGNPLPSTYHNGSKSRDSVPLRNCIFKIFDQLRRLFAIKFFDCKQSEEPEMRNEKSGGERCLCRIL